MLLLLAGDYVHTAPGSGKTPSAALERDEFYYFVTEAAWRLPRKGLWGFEIRLNKRLEQTLTSWMETKHLRTVQPLFYVLS